MDEGVAIGEESNDLLESGSLDVTPYDGWEGNAVDPAGIQDSTKALQKAIEDARDRALAMAATPLSRTVILSFV